jgi:putrescine transport system substrate-binding protein
VPVGTRLAIYRLPALYRAKLTAYESPQHYPSGSTGDASIMKFPILGVSLVAALVAAPALAQQKQVNVYNWSDYIAEDAVANFAKATGIKVNYSVYDANETLDAKLRAGKSGYDVVAPSASPFLVRQIPAGLYQKLDKSKLANYGNLDPAIMKQLAKYDPGNEYSVPWMWGTTGIGYNVDKVKKALPDAPVDSLRMIFDPAVASKLKDCGIMVLDSPTDMIPAALKYLKLDPDSKDPADLEKAAALFKTIRPYIRKFHSSEYINALAQGNICVAFGFSGDIIQAASRAAKSKNKVNIEYAIPKEGALLWIDVLAIPAGAPNLENAYKWIDYLLDPKVAAASSNFVGYANGNAKSVEFLDKAVKDDETIYPPPAVMATLYTISAADQKYNQLRTRTWTTIKTGK